MDKTHQIILNIVISLALSSPSSTWWGSAKYSSLLTAEPDLFALALLTYFCMSTVMAYRIKVVLAAMEESFPPAD